MRNWLFGLPRQIVCEQSLLCQIKWRACSLLCLFRSLWVWTFRVLLILAFLKFCLIITSVSIALLPKFAQNFTLFLCHINREIASK
jgi:hypothetical protein